MYFCHYVTKCEMTLFLNKCEQNLVTKPNSNRDKQRFPQVPPNKELTSH